MRNMNIMAKDEEKLFKKLVQVSHANDAFVKN